MPLRVDSAEQEQNHGDLIASLVNLAGYSLLLQLELLKLIPNNWLFTTQHKVPTFNYKKKNKKYPPLCYPVPTIEFDGITSYGNSYNVPPLDCPVQKLLFAEGVLVKEDRWMFCRCSYFPKNRIRMQKQVTKSALTVRWFQHIQNSVIPKPCPVNNQ